MQGSKKIKLSAAGPKKEGRLQKEKLAGGIGISLSLNHVKWQMRNYLSNG